MRTLQWLFSSAASSLLGMIPFPALTYSYHHAGADPAGSGPASLAQLLDLNDRLNIRIRAWHQLVSQLGHCQTAVPADSSPFQQRSAAAASATSTGPSSDGWGRSGSGRSLGSVEAARSISGGSQPGRWSPAPGSLGIVAPKVGPRGFCSGKNPILPWF